MSKYERPEPFPIKFPFIENPSRAIELERMPYEWDLSPSEETNNLEVEAKRSLTGYNGGFIGKPPHSTDWPPSQPLPGFDGRVPLYRSFRYFDVSKPEFKPDAGNPLPPHANFWGILVPEEYLEALAGAIKSLRHYGSGVRGVRGVHELVVVSRQPAKRSVSKMDIELAKKYIYEFHVPLFLLDRACDTMNQILGLSTGRKHETFFSNFTVVQHLVAVLCHRHAALHGPQNQEELFGLSFAYMSQETFFIDRRNGKEKVFGGSIGQAYSRVLTGLLTGDGAKEPITGLNFLVGGDIPKMRNFDLYFKFGTKVIPLPLHII